MSFKELLEGDFEIVEYCTIGELEERLGYPHGTFRGPGGKVFRRNKIIGITKIDEEGNFNFVIDCSREMRKENKQFKELLKDAVKIATESGERGKR